jgi:hypothetical protein
MHKRPLQVTLLSILYILTGAVGLVHHSVELKGKPFEDSAMLALLISLIAILAGAYMLLRKNWARWLAIVWIAVHVLISFFHTRQELLMHAVMLALFGYLLFRPECNAYFRSTAIEGK